MNEEIVRFWSGRFRG